MNTSRERRLENGEIFHNYHVDIASSDLMECTVKSIIKKFEPSRIQNIRIDNDASSTSNLSHYNLPQNHQSPSTMIEPIQIPRAHFDTTQSKYYYKHELYGLALSI